MVRLLASLLALVQPPAAPDARPTPRVQDAEVVSVSPRPAFGSGVFAVFAHFDVAVPDGRQRMYLLWMGVPDEFLPVPGEVCSIAYRREAYPGLSSDNEMDGRRVVNLVDRLDCPSMLRPQRGNPSAR